MEFVDRQLTCMDCGQPFVFTAGEQEFYERKGFKEEPKRCKNCREARKTRRNGDFMAGASGGGRSNGNGSGHGGMHDDDDNFGNRAPRGAREPRDAGADRGGGRGGPREMFEAVCAQCGVQTRVPFKPVAGRPVYCRECYSSKRGVGL